MLTSNNGHRLEGMQAMDKDFMQALARRAGLDKALAEFPDDVAAAAEQAAASAPPAPGPAEPAGAACEEPGVAAQASAGALAP